MREVTQQIQHTLASQNAAGRRGTRLREVAYQAIKDAILTGKVNSKQPLVEERLAAQLEISRTPVREALAILEHEGLIEAVPYQGLFVKDISLREFQEIYETAETLEPALARQAAMHVTPADIVAMEAMLAKAEAYIGSDIPSHLAACRMFQQKMGECAGNLYLTALLMAIEERSDLYLISKVTELPPDKMLAAVQDRRAILDALRASDAAGAEQASLRHIQALRQRWQEYYHRDDPYERMS